MKIINSVNIGEYLEKVSVLPVLPVLEVLSLIEASFA